MQQDFLSPEFLDGTFSTVAGSHGIPAGNPLILHFWRPKHSTQYLVCCKLGGKEYFH